jgi:hypothetical protein
VVTALALGAARAQSEAMINDTENLDTRTGAATDISDTTGTQLEAKGLRVRSSVKAGGLLPWLNHSEEKGLRMRTPVHGLSRRVRVGVTSAASAMTLAVLTVTFELSAGADIVGCLYCGGIKLNHSEAGVQRLRTP